MEGTQKYCRRDYSHKEMNKDRSSTLGNIPESFYGKSMIRHKDTFMYVVQSLFRIILQILSCNLYPVIYDT